MSKHPTAVIDLDNCISNDAWRWPYFNLDAPLPNDRYWNYHDACEGDLYENADMVRELSQRYQIVVFTSRSEVVRHKTTRWLRKWQVPVTQLFMRPDNNHEPSTVLKKWMLEQAREQGFDVQGAIDDRIDILDMYADEGVRMCRQVFINHSEITHP